MHDIQEVFLQTISLKGAVSRYFRVFRENLELIFIYFLINFASQAGRAPQQLAPITVAPFLPSQP